MCLCSRRACGEQASVRGAAIPAKTRRHRMSCNVAPRRGLLRHSGTTHPSCKQTTSSRFPSCTLLYQWPRRLCVRHPMTRYVAPHVRTSSQKPFSPARGTAAFLFTSADLDIESVDTAALISRIWSDTPRQNPWGTPCRVLNDRSPAYALSYALSRNHSRWPRRCDKSHGSHRRPLQEYAFIPSATRTFHSYVRT